MGLLAIISADASPARKEFATLGPAAEVAGQQVRRGISSGVSEGIGANRGAVTEFIVLLREVARGNLSRIPGTASLFFQRLGIGKLLLKDTGVAARAAAEEQDRLAKSAEGVAAKVAQIAAQTERAAVASAMKAKSSAVESAAATKAYSAAKAEQDALRASYFASLDHAAGMKAKLEAAHTALIPVDRDTMVAARAESVAADIASASAKKKLYASHAVVSALEKESNAKQVLAGLSELESRGNAKYLSDARKIAQDKLMLATNARMVADALNAEAQAATNTSMAMRLLQSPVAWAVAAFVALAAVAYSVYQNFKLAREEAENWKEITDAGRNTFANMAESTKAAADEAQAYADWLSTLTDRHEGLTAAVERTLRVMKKQHEHDKKMKEERGASKMTLSQMDIDEAKKELSAVESAKLQARRNVEQLKEDAAAAQRDQVAFNAPGGGADQLSDRSKRAKEAAELADEVRRLMLKTDIREIDPEASKSAGLQGDGPVYRNRKAGSTDVLEFELGGKHFKTAFEEAAREAQKLREEESELVATQKRIHDLLAQKERLTTEGNEELIRLTGKAEEMKEDLGFMTVDPGKVAHTPVNENQRVGAFAYTGPDSIAQVGRKQLSVLQQIAQNTTPRGGGSPTTMRVTPRGGVTYQNLPHGSPIFGP